MDIDSISLMYNDIIHNLKGKEKKTILKNSAFDRNMLIESVLSLMEVCEKLLKIHDVNQKNAEQLADVFANKTETMIKQLLLNKSDACNEIPELPKECMKQHVLVIDNETDDGEIFSTQSWSNVVKNTISNKLKNIPVSKVALNKQGKGCIFLPSENALSEANLALQSDFSVSQSIRKTNDILPKLKIHNLNTELFESVDELQNLIILKNRCISRQLNENEKSKLSVIFIDRKNKNAVMKVSPDIRDIIMKNSRIFIDMESHFVTDSYHVEQCFVCQGFGHRQNSEFCPNKNGDPVCFFCSSSHRSSTCNVKNRKANHKCVNCVKSAVHDIKIQANSHNANSKTCPVFQKEIERIKRKTCYDAKNYLEN